MRRLPLLATAASLIAGAFLAISSAPASAVGGYDIWGIRGTDRVIDSDACRRLAITASTNISSADFWDASADLYLRGKYVKSIDLFYVSGGLLRGYFRHCPEFGNVGDYKVGPTEVSVWPDDANTKTVFMDYSKGSFKVKQKVRFTKVEATRKGKNVTIKTNPQYYSVGGQSGWYPASVENHSKASRKKNAFWVQRRNANGTGKWKTIKGAKPPKGKTLTVKVKATKKAQYRVITKETRYSFAGHTKTFKR